MKKKAWIMVLALVTLLFATGKVVAQSPRRLHGLDMGNLSMLMDPRICKEIEVVGEQQREILAALREIYRVFNDRNIPSEEKAETLKQMREAVDKQLLPHQHLRLKQLRLQTDIQRVGTASALHGELGRELGLTAGQKSEILEVNAKLRAELTEKIREMQEKARAELFGVLTREQRSRLEKLLGDPYLDPQSLPKF